MWAKVLNISLWVGGLVALLLLLGFSVHNQNELICSDLVVEINHTDEGNFFLTKEDIENNINNMGYKIGKQKANEFDLIAIEKVLNNNASVKKADAFFSVDGKLHVRIIQRAPLFRVFNSAGESFYVDTEGRVMPLSTKYTARVPIVNGAIFLPFKPGYDCLSDLQESNRQQELLRDTYTLCSFIQRNPFWKAQFGQVYIHENGDFELVPKVGYHSILLGDISHMEEKFDNLLVFYNKGLKQIGWNQYRIINLKYKNQIVCTKK